MLSNKYFQISKTRIEFLECKFNKNRNKEEAVRLDGQEISKSESFQYLDQKFKKIRELEEDMKHMIVAVWMKWISLSRVLCDRKNISAPIKLKVKFYWTTIRLTMIYGLNVGLVKATCS